LWKLSAAISRSERQLWSSIQNPAPNPGDSFLVDLCKQLKERFGIDHSTIQVETDPHTACPLEPDQVV